MRFGTLLEAIRRTIMSQRSLSLCTKSHSVWRCPLCANRHVLYMLTPMQMPESTLLMHLSLSLRVASQSAALGLAIAGALALGYANIFVTAPSPENLRTLFEFVFKARP